MKDDAAAATATVPGHLRAVVQHGSGTLARLTAILNSHCVVELRYAVDDAGLARLELALLGGPWHEARARQRLARSIDVLWVEDPYASPER